MQEMFLMSNRLVFDILPFDPLVTPDAKIHLPIDLDDFVRQLQNTYPNGEIRVTKNEGNTSIDLSIWTETEGRWCVANFSETHNYFWVSGWPKRIAKELILWYRRYIPPKYPLFLVIPEYGYVTELTAHLSSNEIEKMYPYPVSDD
ncbi:MAG: hypothetical protein U0694_05125 [Anaerolineae bacterium]